MYQNIKNIKLNNGIFKQRYDINRAYVMKLRNENLLQNHYGEAGLWNPWWGIPEDSHGGWETPASAIRGHFLGHWMSSAAAMYYYHQDNELKARLDFIIDELERCQQTNGGEWVNSCPEKYLKWLLDGKLIGVPHYTIHKTMMGLWDSYNYTGNEKALNILVNFLEYFIKFTDEFSVEEMDDILDFETGGIMEVLADVYNVTKEQKHLALMKRYERRRLFEPLLQGEDVLTNMHANTTVPEVLGAARAYEVTGEERYLDIAKAYWKCGINDRGYYATGGANSGEIWCPSDEFHIRMGVRTQEHCTQYNLIRLAEFLFRHTGEKQYEDFIERSLYNSILAQQNKETGMVAYYLPIKPGGKKDWSTEHHSFWCCCGSLVQAHTRHPSYIAHTNNNEIIISQYIDSKINCNINETDVEINIAFDGQGSDGQRLNPYNAGPKPPKSIKYKIYVKSSKDNEITIKFRVPFWAENKSLSVDGEIIDVKIENGYYVMNKKFTNNLIEVEFAKQFKIVPMPSNNHLVAFMDGPYAMAAITSKELTLPHDFNIESDIRLLDARNWGEWRNEYIIKCGDESVKFVRLCDITDETYSIYFYKK